MITSKTKDLLKAVEFAAQVCGQRSTLAAFSHVLMVAAEKSISVYASNIAISITTNCEAEVKKPEMFGVPARQLVDWLKSLSGETIEGIILEDVSGYYGRTHGAAINAIEVTNNLRATDPDFRRRYESVMQRVKSLTTENQ